MSAMAIFRQQRIDYLDRRSSQFLEIAGSEDGGVYRGGHSRDHSGHCTEHDFTPRSFQAYLQVHINIGGRPNIDIYHPCSVMVLVPSVPKCSFRRSSIGPIVNRRLHSLPRTGLPSPSMSVMAIFRQPRLKVMHTFDSEASAMS